MPEVRVRENENIERRKEPVHGLRFKVQKRRY